MEGGAGRWLAGEQGIESTGSCGSVGAGGMTKHNRCRAGTSGNPSVGG